MFCFVLQVVFYCVIIVTSGQDNASPSIPDYLVECYNDPLLYNRENRLPATMSTLIELIRKVEISSGVTLDINMLAYTLIHRFQMDGIQYHPGVISSPGVTPFSPSGRQFPKHQILLRSLIPGNARLFPNSSLTATEKCALHFMLSSCVDPWERGDESNVCPQSNIMPVGSRYEDARVPTSKTQQTGTLSRCPIEDGVALLKQGGTVNVGRLLAGISTALQSEEVQLTHLIQDTLNIRQSNLTEREPLEYMGETKIIEHFERYQQVNTSGTVRNTWASTLAGDLAEMAVYQGPYLPSSFLMGPPGSWNDTLLPRIQYMNNSNDGYWDATDAELQGSIDGLILGNEINVWVKTMGRLRLSQVLDMYYSNHGINFNPTISICNRTTNFRRLTDYNTLFRETNSFARALTYVSRGVQISDSALQNFTERAVQAYQSYLQTVLNNFRCDSSLRNISPQVHLNVILDSTWIRYQGVRFLAYLAQEADVSYYASSMSAVNGQDGSWLVNATHNITHMFENNVTTNGSTAWPSALNLPQSLQAIKTRLIEKAVSQQQSNTIGDLGEVVVVVAYSSTISDSDFEHARQLIQTFKQNFPNVNFLYVASNLNAERFQSLLTLDRTKDDTVVAITNSQIDTAVKQIVDSLAQVPGKIIGSYCSTNGTQIPSGEYEVYITPRQTTVFRIHPDFLENAELITFQLNSNNYGVLVACLSRTKDRTQILNCSNVSDGNPSSLSVTNPCGTTDECQPIYLLVDVANTRTRCTEDDCRYPDQIRLLIRHSGLRCSDNGRAGDAANIYTPSVYMLMLFFITYWTVR